MRDARRGLLLDEDGTPRTWETRIEGAELPEDLEAEPGPLGAFEIQLPAGTYELIFEAARNDRPQLQDGTSGTLIVEPGATVVRDLRAKVETDAPAVRCFDDRDCPLGARCTGGDCLVDVDADRDRDGVPDGTPEQPRDNCPDLENTDQEDLDGDGSGDSCDDDDDGDQVPDLADDCPLIANRSQADADDDGVGNACDPDTVGTTVIGRLDGSEGGNPDATQARVYLSGRVEAVVPDADGAFVFEQALPEGGAFFLEVEWPGFLPRVVPGEAGLRDLEADVGVVLLVPEATSPERAATMQGQARLLGAEDHAGIRVEARLGGASVSSTLTDEAGAWVMPASRVDHTLHFSRPRYLAPTPVEATWDGEAEVFMVGDTALADHEDVLLAPDLSGGVVGELASTRPNIDWAALAIDVRLVGDRGPAEAPAIVINRFEFADLQPGLYGLQIDVQGHVPYGRVVQVGGLPQDLGMIRLSEEAQDPERRVVLQGAARLSDGALPEGIQVRLIADGVTLDLTETDAEGRYAFEASRLPHTLVFGKEGYTSPAPIEVAWNGDEQRFEAAGLPLEELDVLLQRATGRISVRLDLSPKWIPAEQRHARVRVVGANFRDARPAVSDGVPVVFGPMPVGDYTVLVDREGFGEAQESVVLAQGVDEVGVELALGLRSLARSGLDLEGESVDDDALRALDLRGANLSGITVLGAAQAACDAGEACPEGQRCVADTCRIPADLCGRDLREARLSGADLEGANLAGANLTGADLANADLSGAILGGADLSGAALFGADLGGANLSGTAAHCDGAEVGRPTDLSGADLSTASLAGARLTSEEAPLPASPCDAVDPSILLRGATLTLTNLTGAHMRGVDLRGASLSSAVLVGTRLPDACLQNAALVLTDLSDADLSRADLDGATFLGAVLLRTRLNEARLARANLIGATLVGADLSDAVAPAAVLRGAVLGDAPVRPLVQPPDCALPGGCQAWAESCEAAPDHCSCSAALPATCRSTLTSLRGADLTGADLSQATLQHVDLREASLDQGTLRSTTFLECLLGGHDLPPPTFDAANLRGADLQAADLLGSSLRGADLTGADLTGADLSDADLEGADLSRASVRNAFLLTLHSGTNLSGATLDQTDFSGAFLFGDLLDPNAGTRFTDARGFQPEFDHASATSVGFLRARFTVASARAAFMDGCDFTGAHLGGLQAADADFTESNFTGANFNGGDFSGAKLPGANFTRAVLLGVHFDDAGLDGVTFDEAIVDQSTFHRVDLSFANFAAVSAMRRVDLSGANLSGAIFAGVEMPSSWRRRGPEIVDLVRTRLDGARLDQTDFGGANLQGVSMVGAIGAAIFDGADLRPLPDGPDLVAGEENRCIINRAELDGSSWQGAQLRRCELSGTSLRASDLTNADLSDADFDLTDLTGALLEGWITGGASFTRVTCPDGSPNPEGAACP